MISDSIVLRNQGNAYLSEGKLEDAAACFRQAISLNPCYAEAYTNLGIVFQTQGNLGEAITLYRRAVELKPNLLPAHLNLGSCLMSLGQIDSAELSLQQAVNLASEHHTVLQQAAALQWLGLIAIQRSDFPCAENLLRHALELQPNDAGTHNYLANLYLQTARLTEAEASCRRAIELNSEYAEAHNNLGLIVMQTSEPPETNSLIVAEAAFRRAIELQTDYVDAIHNLGKLLLHSKRLTEAEKFLRQVLVLQPTLASAHTYLGNLLVQRNKFAEAEMYFGRALELNPDYAEAHNGLGILLVKNNRLAEAEVSFRRAMELKLDKADMYYNLAILLVKTNRLDEAEASYRHALKRKPQYADALAGLGLLLLSLGRYVEAWPYYEHRYDPAMENPACTIPSLNFPQWHGESLIGKSLLILPEQGFGDFILFSRFVSLLKERGAYHITLVCPRPLSALMETIAGIDKAVTDLPSAITYDYWSFLLSLPLHLSITLDSIPSAMPYLFAHPTRLEHWHSRLPMNAIKVGLVWKGNAGQGNDANRSLPGLATLASLWSVPKVTFVSLQKGQGEEDAKHPLENQTIIHLGADIVDFADTAAIISHLDIVICVCTSVAHLAGALGKPCWVLLTAIDPSWIWLQERETSPWYSSLRLFRQIEPGNWYQPIERIRQDLLALAHTVIDE